MMYKANFPLKDGDDIDKKDVDVGVQDEIELQSAIDTMLSRGSKHLSKDSLDALNHLVTEYRDIFRVKLGKGPPVDVEPMKIEFERPTRPLKARQRTYSRKQLTFLEEKVRELIDAEYIARNNYSQWASAPLVVPKPGKEGFRFTDDLRPVNTQTKKTVWPCLILILCFGSSLALKFGLIWIFFTDTVNSHWISNLVIANRSILRLVFTLQIEFCTVLQCCCIFSIVYGSSIWSSGITQLSQ